METRFEWDPAKAASNQRKHRVRFEDAVGVFADPFALSVQDRVEGGEARWQTLGAVEGLVVLLVAHTVRDDDDTEVIRLVSARQATSTERQRYARHRSSHG